VENFPGNYSDFRAYETVPMLQKEENKAEKKDWNKTNWKLDL
jgi:ATP-binding cassette subfamily F protein uup